MKTANRSLWQLADYLHKQWAVLRCTRRAASRRAILRECRGVVTYCQTLITIAERAR